VTVNGTDVLSATVQQPAGKRTIIAVIPTPGGISTEPTLWLDASSNANITYDGATRISNWTSLTGSVSTTQSANSKMPRYKVADSDFNFNPYVYFDGTADILENSSTGDLLGTTGTMLGVFGSISGSTGLQFENSAHYQIKAGANCGYTGGSTKWQQSWSAVDPAPDAPDARPSIQGIIGGNSEKLIFKDGFSVSTNSTTAHGATVCSNLSIGARACNSGDEHAEVNIPEILFYDTALSQDDLRKVESYLAIKYGITLGTNGISLDYKSSNGTTVWEASTNSGYAYDISGIAIDNNSLLSQLKSHSINGADMTSFNDILTIANGTDFNSPAAMTDKSYFVWGHNNGPTVNTGAIVNYPTDNSQTIQTILQRHWKTQETGTVTDVVLEFDLSGIIGVNGVIGNNDLSHLRLLVDEDGDFSNGATAYAPTSYDNTTNIAYFDHDFTPTDGTDLTNHNGFFFTLGSTNISLTPLPVTLTQFQSDCDSDGKTKLYWITSSELNNDYYTIEKSKDGIHFFEIETVNGAGNSSSELTYNYTDHNQNFGITYYRLKQTDFNGDYEYFKAISINCDNNQFKIYPNPFIDQISIDLGNLKGEYSYKIKDCLGRLIKEGLIVSNITVVDINQLIAKGIYYMVIYNSNHTEFHNEKIIKL
jgi:hypothetical protein